MTLLSLTLAIRLALAGCPAARLGLRLLTLLPLTGGLLHRIRQCLARLRHLIGIGLPIGLLLALLNRLLYRLCHRLLLRLALAGLLVRLLGGLIGHLLELLSRLLIAVGGLLHLLNHLLRLLLAHPGLRELILNFLLLLRIIRLFGNLIRQFLHLLGGFFLLLLVHLVELVDRLLERVDRLFHFPLRHRTLGIGNRPRLLGRRRADVFQIGNFILRDGILIGVLDLFLDRRDFIESVFGLLRGFGRIGNRMLGQLRQFLTSHLDFFRLGDLPRRGVDLRQRLSNRPLSRSPLRLLMLFDLRLVFLRPKRINGRQPFPRTQARRSRRQT